jgi:hypothetical protein
LRGAAEASSRAYLRACVERSSLSCLRSSQENDFSPIVGNSSTFFSKARTNRHILGTVRNRFLEAGENYEPAPLSCQGHFESFFEVGYAL